jgi:hypothetical protein
MGEEKRRVEFHFGPYAMEQGLFAVEKDESGRKRRYLEGVASGLQVDGHGERMTEQCIKSFQRQAQTGDILLYEGQHGVNFIDDIGKLVGSFIDGEGNWHASFRLYDEGDGLGATTLEKADKVWRQSCGLPPYTVAKQRGFSIEGEIPQGGLQMLDQSGKRIMNDVTLDGVVLVTRPAYEDSIATAVYKALGIPGPWKVKKSLSRALNEKIESADSRETFYRRRYQLNDALDSEITRIMSGPDAERRAQLESLFDEYKKLAVDEIVEHPEIFAPVDEADDGTATSPAIYKATTTRIKVLKEVEAALHLVVQARRPMGRKQ